MLIDSHCHLSFKDYSPEDLQNILSRAADSEVSFMITIGAGEGVDGNRAALEVAQKYPQVFCTVGIHPHDASLVDNAVMQQLGEWALHERVVAIGEMGLDFHYSHSPHDKQEEVLHQQIELAQSINKPIVIHDRDAGDRTHDILKEHGVKPGQVMIHCFTGSKSLAQKYLDLGCFISFTGIVTFKKSEELRDVVRLVPVERMLIETDSPYLAPEPFRGKKNEPSFVRHVASKIAEVKNLSFEDVARITTLNAKRFFSLPMPDLTAPVAYAIRNSLYLNITNRCTLACTFCPKFVDFEVKGYYLKLRKEPTVEEILQSIGDPSRYDEVVFCGFGEPTRRLDALLEVARTLKSKFPKIKIRLNSDGLGNLVHQKNILPDLATCIDTVSVSLNAQDAKTYVTYCPSKYGESAYPAVKDFIRDATKYIPTVIASVVGAPGVDREACRKIVEDDLGAQFRFRDYDVVG